MLRQSVLALSVCTLQLGLWTVRRPASNPRGIEHVLGRITNGTSGTVRPPI
jgi:hypothetical protein